jgi:hypothetical protein
MDKFQVAFKEVMSGPTEPALHAQNPSTRAALGVRDLPRHARAPIADLT